MTYSDSKIIVYVGYPQEVIATPAPWVDTLLKHEAENPSESKYHYYLSGGLVTSELLTVLKGRCSNVNNAQKLASKLVNGHTQRLINHILSPNIEKYVALANEAPLSTEYRILLDLWVLSRSDVYVVDCDLLGHGRCGAESVYAHAITHTLGVSDSSVLDPWYHYHCDSLTKSQLVSRHLDVLRSMILSSRSLPPENNSELAST